MTMQVLIVEDSIPFRELLKIIVGEVAPDITTHSAGGYEEAVALINSFSFDLAILDFTLHDGRTGMDVAAHLKCPCIMITGHDAQTLREVEGVEIQIVSKSSLPHIREAVKRFVTGPKAPLYRMEELSEYIDKRHTLIVATFDSIRDGVLIVAAGGMISFANHAAASITRWPLRDLIGQQVDALLPHALRAKHLEQRHEFAAAPAHRTMHALQPVSLLRRDRVEVQVRVGLAPVGQGVTIVTMREVVSDG